MKYGFYLPKVKAVYWIGELLFLAGNNGMGLFKEKKYG
jgi:hypothetical protein